MPFIGWHLNRSGQIAIDTTDAHSTLSSMGAGVKALRAGMPIFVFPEGSRTPDGAMQPFLSGAAFLAIRAQVPLIPIALSGVYESKLDRLTLDRDILLTSTSGYSGHLREAVIDVKKGSIVSQSPVELEMLNGTLNANRLEVDDRGDVIRFSGGVVMNLVLPPPDSEKK